MKSDPHWSKQSATGQALSEYALVIGVVALVSLGGLALLGGNVFSGMASHRNMFASPGPVGAPPASSGSPTSSAGNPVGSTAPTTPLELSSVPQGFLGTERVCSDSFCVDLPLITPENHRVDTAGGNGGEWVHAFSAVLEQMAAELLAAGVDPGVVSLISALAGDGHGMGSMMNQLSLEVSPDGSTDLAHEFILSKGQFEASTFMLNDFVERYPETLSPMSKATIDAQVAQINTLIGGIQMDRDPVRRGTTPGLVTFHEVELVHQSANTICDQGGENCHYVAN